MSKYGDAMDAGEFYVGKVCQDCMIMHANGDDSGISSDWNRGAYLATTEFYNVVMGHPHHSEYWSDCPHDGTDCPDDADCDCRVTEFSTHACDMCGSTLHGYREDAVFIKWSVLA